jgi:hypothetical protein
MNIRNFPSSRSYFGSIAAVALANSFNDSVFVKSRTPYPQHLEKVRKEAEAAAERQRAVHSERLVAEVHSPEQGFEDLDCFDLGRTSRVVADDVVVLLFQLFCPF